MEKKKDQLLTPIIELKGVGPKIAVMLEGKGIKTIEDLFWFLPVRYMDRSVIKTIGELTVGERASIVAKVAASRSLFFRHSRKKAYEAIVEDETGSISIKWFQWVGEYLKQICKKGNLLLLSGEITKFGDRFQMVHPEIHILGDENEAEDRKTIAPIYSEIDGLKQGTLRTLMKKAFEDYGICIESVVPESIEEHHKLAPLYNAFLKIHFPEKDDLKYTNIEGSGIQGYLHRLIFEEYFLFQLALLIKKEEVKKNRGIRFKPADAYYRRFKANLPFKLTYAQERVIKEIENDMGQGVPMNRLLQGDVGSGKTICAVMASLVAVDNNYQVALMAPTEILAEQHYLTMHKYFDEMGISLVFLRGNMGSDRKHILEGIKNGKTRVIIGTHAIIQKDVVFKKLGLVIIDEQHRFGVIQRKLLKEKGSEIRSQESEEEDFQLNIQHSTLKTDSTPDALVMTATPIPRTLSMVIYGDLDVSIIDEMPKDRQKISTKALQDKDKAAVYKMVEDELKKGRQAYVVCPLIEESDKIDLLNAKEMAAYLQTSVFPSYRVGLLHGRMKPEEKEGIMARFKDRETDVLVCTTVIEVGIDVPNATIIIIENAERFGLSQLHQLRGRVGRGKYPSKCILITSAKRTAPAAKRLRAMEETTDGFIIAEEDMKLRGPGDMLGVRQAGLPDFRVGDIVRDVNIMLQARKIAGEAMLEMTDDDLDRVQEKARKRWKGIACLSDVA
ncbi:MAG: ATP-dependent DNA helicase RecG [Proteobacteria bacterium]|nr:ATP-dependent DNA helicase RecG [Pseudomonadota bacterium]